MDVLKINFIAGIGRSGTSLIMSMLNAHPLLQATPEVNFFNFFYGSWKHKNSFNDEDYVKVAAFVNSFKNRQQASGFSWDMEIFRNNISKLDIINFRSIYQCFYTAFSYANKLKFITHNFDKNPINTLFLDDILSSFPTSKIIYMVRDPRANFLSRKEKPKKWDANIYFDSHRWAIYNTKALEVMERNEARFHVVRYEDFVVNPQSELEKIAIFCDFEFDATMMNFYQNVLENSLKHVDEEPMEPHPQVKVKYENLSRPVNSDRLNVWKEKLSGSEISICSAICKIAYKFGYNIQYHSSKANVFENSLGYLKAQISVAKDLMLYKIPLNVKLKFIKSV